MASLSGADLRATLDFVAEVHEFESIERFRGGVLPGLLRLVPGDLVGYNEVEPGGEAMTLTYPVQTPEWAGVELARLAHEHPLIASQASGDRSTHAISDFLGPREFRALELYAELYRRIGAEDQIAFGLPGPAVIGIAWNRAGRGFSERDRALLELLRPHLAGAHRRVVERDRSAARLAALERGLAEQDAAILVLDGAGSVTDASEGASALLAAYFPAPHGRTGLPAALAAWLELPTGLGGPTPLTIDGPRGRLTVRAVTLPHGGRLLCIDEEPLPTPERLRELGLTRRQAEVLSLLATGSSVEEIAGALFLSRATVRKHLEHVYARLGVHTRAEAVARALSGASARSEP
jgi:DNA-binding CsgD family transcriptional regulator